MFLVLQYSAIDCRHLQDYNIMLMTLRIFRIKI